MSAPSALHRQWASQLLGQNEGVERVPSAVAMERAVKRLLGCAGPFIGNNGVRALLARSEKLSACEPPADYASATVVLATFLSLLSSFIGERLTRQILETPWKPSEENK